jgi:hypothetical protein
MACAEQSNKAAAREARSIGDTNMVASSVDCVDHADAKMRAVQWRLAFLAKRARQPL